MGLSVLRLAGGAVHGSESHAGAAVARRSSANPRAACTRLLHSIRERERDRHQSERCGYPFGAADPASRLLPCPLAASALIMTSIAAGPSPNSRVTRGHLTIAAIWNQSIPKNQIRTPPLLKLRSRYIVPNFVRTLFVRF